MKPPTTPLLALLAIGTAASASAQAPVCSISPSTGVVAGTEFLDVTIAHPQGPSAITAGSIDAVVGGTTVNLWPSNPSLFAFGTNAAGDLVATSTIDLDSMFTTLSASVLTFDVSATSAGGTGTASEVLTLAQKATSVSTGPVTWTFGQARPVGQFVTGDWWVIGPVDIVSISPQTVVQSGRAMHGSMVAPSGNTPDQGYDSAIANFPYSAASNDAVGISGAAPLQVAPGSSVVSASSGAPNNNGGNLVGHINNCAVLTVLADPAQPSAFRPPYCGTGNVVQHDLDTVAGNAALLQSLPAPTGVSYSGQLATSLAAFTEPWLDHRAGWSARYLHPATMPDYGAEVSRTIGDAMLLMHSDLPFAQKEPLLIQLVQLGIDLYGITQNGGDANWEPDGGHASGRKWPIVFAGLMLNDSAMVSVSAAFGEDLQTFYVEYDPVLDLINGGHGGYVDADVGLPDWGIRHGTNPSFDNVSWTNPPYRLCCTAKTWFGAVLSARMSGAVGAWGHPALFDYMDRYVAHPAVLGNGTAQPGAFQAAMWSAYRPLF